MYHFNMQPPQCRNEQANFRQAFRQSGSHSIFHPVITSSLRPVAYFRPNTLVEDSDDLYEAPGIFRTNTETDVDDELEIKRTSSGGLFMKNRSKEEKDEISRVKANQMFMCSVFQVSDACDIELDESASLNHKPREATAAPRSKTISAKQADKDERTQGKSLKEKNWNKKGKQELKAQKKEEEQKKRKEKLKKRAEKKGHSSFSMIRLPLSHKQEETKCYAVVKNRNTTNEESVKEDFSLADNDGMATNHSANTSKGHHIQPVYVLPAIC